MTADSGNHKATTNRTGALPIMRTTRRALLTAAGGFMASGSVLSACGEARKPPWAYVWFYKYRVHLEIDGRPYELGNGGAIVVTRGGAYGDSQPHDYAFPAVMRLASGEILAVFPPSLAGMIDRSHILSGAIAELPSFPYTQEMRPTVFIFDKGAKPSRVEGYVMPVAQNGGASRVKLLSIANEWTRGDERQSVLGDLPWYKPSETACRILVAQGDKAAQEYVRANSDQFVHDMQGRFSPQPALFCLAASIGPIEPRARKLDALQGLPPAFEDLGNALARGERVDLPLKLTGRLDDGTLTWPDDPRVFVFRPMTKTEMSSVEQGGGVFPIKEKWQDATWYYALIMKTRFAAQSLGSLKFARDFKGNWLSSDGAWRLDLGFVRVQLVERATAGLAGGSDTTTHAIR